MAAIDGDIFVLGVAVGVEGPMFLPRRDQRGTYPGLNGVESIDLGDQGAYSTVSGRIFGNSRSALIAAMQNLYNYWDGNPHVFTDNLNYSWPQVKVESLEFGDRIAFDPMLGYTRRYVMRLFHLIT